MGIPVTFIHNGREYSGILTPVMGAGDATVFHLMVNNYYWGRLRYSECLNGWLFDSEILKDQADWFEYVITACYQ
jgi:hypothetical protein